MSNPRPVAPIDPMVLLLIRINDCCVGQTAILQHLRSPPPFFADVVRTHLTLKRDEIKAACTHWFVLCVAQGMPLCHLGVCVWLRLCRSSHGCRFDEAHRAAQGASAAKHCTASSPHTQWHALGEPLPAASQWRDLCASLRTDLDARLRLSARDEPSCAAARLPSGAAAAARDAAASHRAQASSTGTRKAEAIVIDDSEPVAPIKAVHKRKREGAEIIVLD